MKEEALAATITVLNPKTFFTQGEMHYPQKHKNKHPHLKAEVFLFQQIKYCMAKAGSVDPKATIEEREVDVCFINIVYKH